MDFWYVGRGLAVHKSCLVALITDIDNWRPCEIAQIQGIEVECPRVVSLDLEFHDGHKHRERTCMPDLIAPPSVNEVTPLKEVAKIYYRYPVPLNGNPADHAMVDNKQGLNDLVRDYEGFRRKYSGDKRVEHLSRSWLEMQYALSFKIPFPSRINLNKNGNNHI